MNPSSATLAELRALAEAPNPDARLLVACDRFIDLTEESRRLWRRKPVGYLEHIRQVLGPEADVLEAEIASTRARTPIGCRAKAEAALKTIPGQVGTRRKPNKRRRP